jgi:formate-dependent nitrite reductase membrane component NrfD
MMSLYIVWYLFFAGIGSGTFVVTAIETRHLHKNNQNPIEGLRARAISGYLVAAFCMVLASVFLVSDLGIPLSSWRVLLVPFSSITAFGACCVVLFTVFSVAVALASLMLTAIPLWLLRLAESIGILLALATMVYSGVLLAMMAAIPVWHTWLIPALFVVSSFASGSAVFLVLEAFLPNERMSSFATWQVHLGFSLLEAAIIVAFVFDRMDVSRSAYDSVMSLLVGDYAMAFWLGGVGAGLVLPVLIHILYRKMPLEALVIVASLGVLVGAFFLRFCIVGIALHQPMFPV